jgi:hypothetical protein
MENGEGIMHVHMVELETLKFIQNTCSSYLSIKDDQNKMIFETTIHGYLGCWMSS